MKNMIKRIIIGVIIGLVLMACRKYLFINVSAATLQGQDINSPAFATINSNYNNVVMNIWNTDIYPNESTWSLDFVHNKFVYITACTDMPTLGYSFNPFWNSSIGAQANGGSIRYSANLTDKTCTFSNGYQAHVAYFKFRLVHELLNVGNSNYTMLYNNPTAFNFGTNRAFSFTIQNIVPTNEDIDIYDTSIDVSGIINAQNVTNQAINNTTNAVNNNTNAINNVNSSLTDETSPDANNDLFSGITTDDESNSPISDLILLPLTLLNAYVEGFSSTCNSFDLGTLYGHNLVLPCINVDDYLGSNLWGLIDVICSIFLIYNVGMMCVSMYESITSLEDGFRGLYTPRHADSGYKPKHGGDN